MSMRSIGEFGLISWIRKRVWLSSAVVQGPGDDCAVLPFSRTHYQLATCDMLVEDVDFTAKSDPYLVGRKAVCVSVSDIAACGGVPAYAVVSAAFPRNTRGPYAKALAQGLIDACRKYRVSLVGGDLSSGHDVTVDVCMMGRVEKKCLVLRSGAKTGDRIFVTGAFGGSMKGKHLRFEPRVKESRYLVSRYKVHAMIDVSDGLCQDLGHILDASKKGAVIHTAQIPLSRDASGIRDALSSGEDFELLFTVGRRQAALLERDAGIEVKCIGEVIAGKGIVLQDAAGKRKQYSGKGYTHF